MTTTDDSSYEEDNGKRDEYYEEIDTQALDFRKRKTPPPPPKKPVQKPVVVDPIQQLNERLNRQFRPDLAPSPPPVKKPEPPVKPPVKRTPSPDNVIFDARTNVIKSQLKTYEPLADEKTKPTGRTQPLATSTAKTNLSLSRISLVPPKLDQNSIQPSKTVERDNKQKQKQNLTETKPSQFPTMVSQRNPGTIGYNNSMKNNKVAPPPTLTSQPINRSLAHNSFQSPSSMMSTNELLRPSYRSERPTEHRALKSFDQSKSNKKKQKHSDANSNDPKKSNRTFALYNQGKGRVEGVVKSRINVAADDVDGDRIVDDTKPKNKMVLWLGQPLCFGLTRLSGGLLFGSMIILGAASIAGLVASIVLYNQDSVTDAQWKILGMVVCAIMLITIIITLLIFLCCYKNGYMFNHDDEIDPNDPTSAYDVDGNERQKAVLRKIYKFNRPHDTPSIPSRMLHDEQTPAPETVEVTDKQTNTESTIAVVVPKDFDRGVWTSKNAFGGITYRPLIPPKVTSRIIQVVPNDIEQTMQTSRVVYQVVEPPTRVTLPPIQSRIVQIPAQTEPIVEVIDTGKQTALSTIIRQPTRIEYVDVEGQRARQVIQQPQYQIVEERPRQVIQQPQYQIVEEVPRQVIQQPQYQIVEERPRQVIQQPQYQIVEERPRQVLKQPQYQIVEERPRQVLKQPQYQIVEERPRQVLKQPQYQIVEDFVGNEALSSVEDIVEYANLPAHGPRHGKIKEKRHKGPTVSVKHVQK